MSVVGNEKKFYDIGPRLTSMFRYDQSKNSSFCVHSNRIKLGATTTNHNDTQHNDIQPNGLIFDTAHQYRAPNAIMLSGIMMSVTFFIVTLSVIMLNVVAP